MSIIAIKKQRMTGRNKKCDLEKGKESALGRRRG